MNLVKFYAFGAIFLFCGCSVPVVMASKVTGPEVVEAGKLATFEADTQGAFLIIPAKDGEFQIDSGGKRLYFASTTNGTYTIIHSCIENGAISQTQKTFTVGKSSKPEPDPDPEPEPDPDDSLTKAIQTGVQDLKSTTLNTEKKALREAFESVTTGIDDGTIKTPEDARATLRVTWQKSAIEIGKDVAERWKPVLDTISEKMDTETLDGLKVGCTEVAKALETITEEEEPKNGCKDGKCPTQNYYRYWR